MGLSSRKRRDKRDKRDSSSRRLAFARPGPHPVPTNRAAKRDAQSKFRGRDTARLPGGVVLAIGAGDGEVADGAP
jgi:hypothetical protein